MPLPSRKELRLQFLQAIADGEWHTHEEIAALLAERNQLTESETQNSRGSSYQSPLDNEINWIKGNELTTTFNLIEYRSGNTRIIRLTEDGKKVLKANPPNELEYDFIRRVLI